MERLGKASALVGDRNFYKKVLVVAIPIMIQNGITNFVSLLDNIMVGQVGTEQMSGVAIANQLLFVFNMCAFGAVAGAGILGAQFFVSSRPCQGPSQRSPPHTGGRRWPTWPPAY